MTNLATNVTNPAELPLLNKDELLHFLNNANQEAELVQQEIDKIIIAQDRINQLQQQKNKATKISIPVLFILLICWVIPGIIYAVVKSAAGNKYNEEITNRMADADQAEKSVQIVVANCKALQIVPSDYRTPLALRTMIKYISNGQADSWKECSLRYDEQSHRWTLERNSVEALQYQEYTAKMAQLTARNTTISAVSDVLSWLR
jgi:hypothetical protein